jgi:hypothetical protein
MTDLGPIDITLRLSLAGTITGGWEIHRSLSLFLLVLIIQNSKTNKANMSNMSLNSFLFTLMEDKEVGSYHVEIVQDNAKTDDCRRVLLPERAEREPRCRWSKLKRQESDSCLIQPSRGMASPSQLPRSDRMKTCSSDSMLLRMPRRVQSPQKTLQKSATSQASSKNATWDKVDLNQSFKKKADSKKLFSYLLTAPEKSTKNGTCDPLKFGLNKVPSSRR